MTQLQGPGVPKDYIFNLRYKKGAITIDTYFRSKSLESAISLGKEYCERNGLHFIFVSQWEMDLQDLLNKKEELSKAT